VSLSCVAREAIALSRAPPVDTHASANTRNRESVEKIILNHGFLGAPGEVWFREIRDLPNMGFYFFAKFFYWRIIKTNLRQFTFFPLLLNYGE
jgi:hypothetical protein